MIKQLKLLMHNYLVKIFTLKLINFILTGYWRFARYPALL